MGDKPMVTHSQPPTLGDLASSLDEAARYLPQTGEDHGIDDALCIIGSVADDLRQMARATAPKMCKASIRVKGSFEDGACTFRCELPLHHEGEHEESNDLFYGNGWTQHYRMTWQDMQRGIDAASEEGR